MRDSMQPSGCLIDRTQKGGVASHFLLQACCLCQMLIDPCLGIAYCLVKVWGHSAGLPTMTTMKGTGTEGCVAVKTIIRRT